MGVFMIKWQPTNYSNKYGELTVTLDTTPEALYTELVGLGLVVTKVFKTFDGGYYIKFPHQARLQIFPNKPVTLLIPEFTCTLTGKSYSNWQ